MSTEQIQIDLLTLLRAKSVYTTRKEQLLENIATLNEVKAKIREAFTGMSYESVEEALDTLNNNYTIFMEQYTEIESCLELAENNFGKLMGYCDSFHQVVMDHEGTSLYQTGTISGAAGSLRLDYNQPPTITLTTEAAFESANAIYNKYTQMASNVTMARLTHATGFTPRDNLDDVSTTTANVMKSLSSLLLAFHTNGATIPCYREEVSKTEETIAFRLGHQDMTFYGITFTGDIYDSEKTSLARTMYLLLTNPTGITDTQTIAEFEKNVRGLIERENLEELQLFLEKSAVPKNNNAEKYGMEIHPTLEALIYKFDHEIMAYHASGGTLYRENVAVVLEKEQEAMLRLSSYNGLFKAYLKHIEDGGFPVTAIVIKKLTTENIGTTSLNGIDINPNPYDFILRSGHGPIPYESVVLEARSFDELHKIEIVNYMSTLRRDFTEEAWQTMIPLMKLENGNVDYYSIKSIITDLAKYDKEKLSSEAIKSLLLDLADKTENIEIINASKLLTEGAELGSAVINDHFVSKLLSLVKLNADIKKSNAKLLENIQTLDSYKFLAILPGSAQFTTNETTKSAIARNIAYDVEQLHFNIFAYRMTSGKEWDNKEMKATLENELATMTGIESAIVMTKDKETYIGDYADWAARSSSDEVAVIAEVKDAIKELGTGSDIEDRIRAEFLGVSVSEFKEIISKNYMEYPEYWEALYEMTQQ